MVVLATETDIETRSHVDHVGPAPFVVGALPRFRETVDIER